MVRPGGERGGAGFASWNSTNLSLGGPIVGPRCTDDPLQSEIGRLDELLGDCSGEQSGAVIGCCPRGGHESLFEVVAQGLGRSLAWITEAAAARLERG